MTWEIHLSPAGRLTLAETEGNFTFSKGVLEGLQTSFVEPERGLLHLATKCLGTPLPSGLSFWREFAQRFLVALRQVTQPDQTSTLPAEPTAAELAGWVLETPPFTGGEYVTPDLFLAQWQALGALARKEAAITEGGMSGWLDALHPSWQNVGRVTFHLAENKRDPELPFAFLASYTHRLSAHGTPQHLPLGKAFQEYAGAANKTGLVALLTPVQRAAERSPFVKTLLDTRRIFTPQGWSVQAAHSFLRAVPEMEEAGLLVRVPDWWKKGAPARPQVSVNVGETKGGGLGFNVMLSFRVSVSLGGEPLSTEEWDQLMESADGLVAMRGQWVEVDREKLQHTLERWRTVERIVSEYGVTFTQAMRMISGLGGAGEVAAEALDETSRDWSEIVAGDWLQQVLTEVRDPESAQNFDPNQDIQATLRPYQRKGVHWLWFLTRLGLGACLADDMGLGKTLQVIALLAQLRRENPDAAPTLLVAPASLLRNWQGEVARFAPGLRCLVLHPSILPSKRIADMAKNAGAEFRDYDLVITTYGLVHRFEWLQRFVWRLIVLDEAQAIKNPGSQQTRSVKKLQAPARIALTGTPVENRLGDLWSLFDFLSPGLLGKAAQFSKVVKGLQKDSRHFAPLRTLISPYILRRLKSDKSIIADLPDKTEVETWCALEKTQAALYQQSVRELAQALNETEGIERKGLVLGFLMRFKQICNHPSQWLKDNTFNMEDSGKYKRLVELCTEIAERQEKVLVFTQFQEMTGPLAEVLTGIFKRAGLILHGGTPIKERQSLVSAFQSEDGPPFFVLSIKAGGTGLTLTAASHVIHFDRWWNPAVENQATDRAYRIGQKRNVLVHRFICRGTIEEKIHSMLQDKQKLATDVLSQNGEVSLTEMDNDDLIQLVSLDMKSAIGEGEE